ncbi:DUF2637 domain-containing protein [Streptomyces sp. H51]|uniref:DUF2637 domain-containing protein n=1 Tax=Streptomyces sp. H51 TaxID=3111770 RepID=UPI002D765797|nr:DUF2637 domain-containing protein [Streptomyces sp. H51]
MEHDYADPSFPRRERYSDDYAYAGTYESDTAWPGRPGDTLHPGMSLVPPDSGWDPVEELAYLLQEAVPGEQPAGAPPPRNDSAPDGDFADPMQNLAKITAQLPPIRRPSAGHRRTRDRKSGRARLLQTGSLLIVAVVAVIVAVVDVLGAVASYGPLQSITADAKGGTVSWWPLLVYGPWTVASLSILRTALHRRRALHSWLIVLLFSSVAMMLCVAQADRTFTGVAGAALPALASLACFQQLVRQVTLTLPPRQRTPRHRQ